MNHPFLAYSAISIQKAWDFWPNGKLFPFFNDHAFEDKPLLPAAGYLEMGLAIGREVFESECLAIEELELVAGLFLPDNDDVPRIRVSVDRLNSNFQVHSDRTVDDRVWTLHAQGGIQTRSSTVRFE